MITLLSNVIKNDSGIDLPIKTNIHYSLTEFINLLQQCNPKSAAKITFLIIENDEIRYKDIFKLGFHNPTELLTMIKNNALVLQADDNVMATINRLEQEQVTAMVNVINMVDY